MITMARTEKRSTDFNEILSVFRKRVWLLGFFMLGMLVVIVAYNELVRPLYQTEFSIMYEELIQPIPNTEFYQTHQRRETILSNQVEEISSRNFFIEVSKTISADLVSKFTFPEELVNENSSRMYLSSLIRRNTEVSIPENNSNVIKIKYYDEDPELALQVAQTISSVITHRTIKQRKQNISSARQLIEDQLTVYKTKLDTAEKQLRDFKETYKISSLNQETNELLKQITEAEVLLTTAKSQKKATEQRLNYIRQKIESEQSDLMPNAIEIIIPRVEKLSDKLVDLELQRTDLLMKGYSNQHPKLIKLAEEINQTRANLSSETQELIQKGKFVDPLSQLKDFLREAITLEANFKAYDAQVKTLKKILDDYDDKIQILPDLELQLARLIRDINTNEKIYTMLLEERERTRIIEAQNTGNIRVIDPPELPTSPIRPRKKLNILISILLGFIIGSIIVFVLESLDTSISSSEDIKRFSDFSVLGTIPKIKSVVNGHLNIFDPNKKPTREEINQLITLYDSHSYAAEAFRMLRTNLQFSSSDFSQNSVLITSPQPGEGKSTTAINLAITTAQLGYNTLLVDADLRRPVLHKIFRQNREPGLVDILQSDTFKKVMKDHLSTERNSLWDNFTIADKSSDLDHMTNEPYNFLINDRKLEFENRSNLYSEIQKMVNQVTGIEHLSLLTTGSVVENSSEILGSKIMKTFISLVKKKFDVVLIDSPPVLVVTDTTILGSLVDGVLIVCVAGKTHQRTISRTSELLEKGKAKIWGVVLNQSLEENIPRSYKKYYKTVA